MSVLQIFTYVPKTRLALTVLEIINVSAKKDSRSRKHLMNRKATKVTALVSKDMILEFSVIIKARSYVFLKA